MQDDRVGVFMLRSSSQDGAGTVVRTVDFDEKSCSDIQLSRVCAMSIFLTQLVSEKATT